MTNLIDTMPFMVSEDHKKRLVAEYWQVSIRYNKLVAMLELWDAGKLTFTPPCPRELYNEQVVAMSKYLLCLHKRAELEGINLCQAST